MFFLKNRSSSIYRFFTILSLIVAGEAVFVLPFHITRFFRPTFMEVFGFTHSQLGFAQGMYGLMAMLAYFPGGFLADKFQARNLIVLSLLTTALSGLSLLSIPGFVATCFLWAFWGLSTILFLWAALIKAIREWASKDEQAFGYALLDSGRGLYAIVLASLSVGIFANYLPEDLSMSSDQQRLVSLQCIVYFYILTTLGSALLVWMFVPAAHGKKLQANTQVDFWQTTKTIVKMPQCWLISFLVISSYIAWKGLDNIGLYLKDVYGYTEVEAAWLSTYSAWTRIVAAIASGLIADRLTPSSVISFAFMMVALSFAYLGFAPVQLQMSHFVFSQILVGCFGTFALRAIYFSLVSEASIPMSMTGSFVGIISFLGFTPDVFVGIVQGYFLDTYPGEKGHQFFWLFISLSSILGLLVSLYFRKNYSKAS